MSQAPENVAEPDVHPSGVSARSIARSQDEGFRSRALHVLGRLGLVILLAIVVITFSIWVPDSFFTWGNFRGTFDQQAIILAVALGVMLPLLVGEFDLSIGAIAGMAAMFTVGLCTKSGLSPALSIVVAVLLTMAVGLANGLLVVKLKVGSFVATLGTSTLIVGILQLYTGGNDITVVPAGLTDIGRTDIIGLPLPVIVVAAVAIGLLIITQRLALGRHLVAVGANRRAAELSGLRPRRLIVLSFVAGAAVAGIGGAFYAAELGSASLNTGPTLLLPGFAAAFLGATAITPGRFNVIGTTVAVLLLAFTVSGLEYVGVDSAVQYLIQGAALIVAVALSQWAISLRQSRLRAVQLELLTSISQRDQGEDTDRSPNGKPTMTP